MNPQIEKLLNKLKDERSKKVIFLSHCILNENTRYLGGAFRPGGINEITEEIQKHGIGIVQMKCPEVEAWGGVLKQLMWFPLFHKYRLVNKVFVPFFLWYTSQRYKKIAQDVVDEILEYHSLGFQIVGIIGVSASPTCGVHTSLDIIKFKDFLRNSTVEDITRRQLNEDYIRGSLVPRSGLFIEILKHRLESSHLNVPFYEHDLLKELNGEKIQFEL